MTRAVELILFVSLFGAGVCHEVAFFRAARRSARLRARLSFWT